MSDARDHIDPPDDDTLAAEYALGVLDQRTRVAVERRIARERGFAALVEAWQLKLTPWADDVAPVQPPLDVWNRISAALPTERPAVQTNVRERAAELRPQVVPGRTRLAVEHVGVELTPGQLVDVGPRRL